VAKSGNGNGNNGDARSSEATLREQMSTNGALPPQLVEAAFVRTSASVVIPSAEGVNLYRGSEGDPDIEGTREWLRSQINGDADA
jgi:hypothetical protein